MENIINGLFITAIIIVVCIAVSAILSTFLRNSKSIQKIEYNVNDIKKELEEIKRLLK